MTDEPESEDPFPFSLFLIKFSEATTKHFSTNRQSMYNNGTTFFITDRDF